MDVLHRSAGSRTLIFATNQSYFEEVLDRITGRPEIRALSPKLVEWGFLDAQQPFWGVRHYNRLDAPDDPTSPLAGKPLAANSVDDGAVGCMFSYAPSQKTLDITYISKNTNAIPIFQEMFDVAGGDGPVTKVQAGGLYVVKSLAPLKNTRADRNAGVTPTLMFILQALGHAVFV